MASIIASPLRWGICAGGEISNDFVSSLQGHSDSHLVVGIATRSLERSQKFATKFKIPSAYASYEELAQDPNVDVVYIGAINTAHHDLCMLFLNHKKHVLCEKPLALTLRETQDILKTAKKNDVFFMEAMWTRFFPVSAKIRELVSSGQLGDVKSVLINFGIYTPDRERTIKRDYGGGALYDMGVYMVYMTTMIFNGVAPISSITSGVLNDDGVDEMYTTVMRFRNNTMATLSCTITADYPNEVFISGTKGHLKIPGHFWAPTELIWSKTTGELIETFQYPTPESTVEYSYGPLWSGMLYEADAVKQAIDEGKTEHALMPWKETELVASLLEKARLDLGIVWVHQGQSPIVVLA
ncbi:trans-1,2-dihydrobenzene-1,2-diol dehydrogenase-like [Lytechinus variegatus]|uniref:trans-1,2-dihydrobenzene-1,2-diol dehydrogenase-like n=1 Tax=Lytechinus variegatus TaxID=7654 RepID=UPI001BB119EC|nr:trans-1,2-dihydrobenzene-1,2-diol dehydrogenase-like [Lytechinus variegatus]